MMTKLLQNEGKRPFLSKLFTTPSVKAFIQKPFEMDCFFVFNRRCYRCKRSFYRHFQFVFFDQSNVVLAEIFHFRKMRKFNLNSFLAHPNEFVELFAFMSRREIQSYRLSNSVVNLFIKRKFCIFSIRDLIKLFQATRVSSRDWNWKLLKAM